MSARQVKVLHRAKDGEDSDSDGGSSMQCGCQQVKQLQAEVESLKQRLEQAKASSASERKRLADELKIERAGRQRAEELLVKQAKELESVTAAKGRLEEAFSRSMSELRYTRLEYTQAEETIQQLLRELMLLREIITRLSILNSSSSTPAGSAAGSSGGEPEGISSAAAAAGTYSNKRISRTKLLGELSQLRAAKAEAESKRDSLLQRLGALEAEKERAEESQEMISRETAKLLDDKRKLLTDLGSKDEAVRGLEAGLDHLHHQLELALADRQLLLDQLTRVADKGELAALHVHLEDGSPGASDDCGQEDGDECGYGNGRMAAVGSGHEQQQQLLEAQLQELQLLQQGAGLAGEGSQPVTA